MLAHAHTWHHQLTADCINSRCGTSSRKLYHVTVLFQQPCDLRAMQDTLVLHTHTTNAHQGLQEAATSIDAVPNGQGTRPSVECSERAAAARGQHLACAPRVTGERSGRSQNTCLAPTVLLHLLCVPVAGWPGLLLPELTGATGPHAAHTSELDLMKQTCRHCIASLPGRAAPERTRRTKQTVCFNTIHLHVLT